MISHQHRVIFVHIPKTGGQSVERAFLADAQISWEARTDFLIGRNPVANGEPKALEHLFAAEYVPLGYLSREAFDTYFKFAVVRNPWDRIVSEYKYTIEHRPRFRANPPSFEAFVGGDFAMASARLARHLEPQAKYILSESGSQIVDAILRFEELSRAFEDLTLRLLGRPLQLERTNVSESRDDYRSFYTPDTASLVADRYKEDIRMFGYRFEA